MGRYDFDYGKKTLTTHMNLRQRLFFLVGGLFVFAFVISTFFESHWTQKYLSQEEGTVTQKIIEVNDALKTHLEEFLRDAFLETEARINALLKRIDGHQSFKNLFLEKSAWYGASILLMTNHWIDFIQTAYEGDLTSGVMIYRGFLDDAFAVPLEKDIIFYFIKKSEKWTGPYIGLNLNPTGKGSFNPQFWVLFRPEAILNFDRDKAALYKGFQKEITFPPFFSEQMHYAFQKSFLEQIIQAQDYFKKNPELFPRIPQDPEKFMQLLVKEKNLTFPNEEKQDLYEEILEKNEERIIEVEMMWNMAIVFLTPPSLGVILGIDTPSGIVAQNPKNSLGKAILNEEVLFSKPYFDASSCLQKNVALCHEKSMSIAYIPKKDRVFFLNLLRLGKDGYIALGVDGVSLLKKLALATHKYTVFVSKNAAIAAFNPDGEEIQDPAWRALPVNQLLPTKSGTLQIGDTNYFYLHLFLLDDDHFHFFIFTPQQQAFALVDTLKTSSKNMISKLSIHMRIGAVLGLIIVLLLLNRIAKKITQPIARLARAANSVEKGHYEEVHLPEIEINKNDEVSILYNSFSEMVQGLKEKEKVRGVLNKVVSSEIAEEILKGKIHLGGEVKTVTVLFADIRGFTHISEKMQPMDVVDLLNTCMTKISHVIDQRGGVIDKYVGDEVMALFGAPLEKEDSAYQAVVCAKEIVEVLKSWNRERENLGKVPIAMGIGIHTGPVLVGNMGAENRLNYTVLGANVNLASRLCSIAGPMEIFISKETLDAPSVKGKFESQEVSSMMLKGFTKPINVFKIL